MSYFIRMYESEDAAQKAAAEYAASRTDYPTLRRGIKSATGNGFIAPLTRGQYAANVRIAYISMVGKPTRLDGWCPVTYGGQCKVEEFGWVV